jgi:hydroxyacylglutathione hydrolase
MSLVFEHVLTEGIAQLSYLIGDDKNGTAAVIDPRPDVELYLKLARQHKVAITHVFETHIHADFVSGARELAARTGTANVYASHEGGASYAFDHEGVKDGDTFELGSAVLTARHTPGHTPEHLAYLVAEKKQPDAPWGVFTGDSLFVNSAGRPDLLGERQANELAAKLHDTLYGFYLKLDDGIILLPGHGHGSPCGADIGDRLTSTVAQQRRSNSFLQYSGRKDEFIEYALSTAPPEPTYYKRMKKVNAAGPEVLGNLPVVPCLPSKAFQAAIEKGEAVVVDTRSMLAFGGGHVPGSLNIGGSPMLSIWAGWMIDPTKPVLLVLEDDSDLEKVIVLFLRVGHTSFAGYLVGGMTAWNNAGLPLAETDQMTVHEIRRDEKAVQILDVRSPSEWEEGHIPGARHIFLPELRKRTGELDKDKPVAAYCDSGYRASIAASILRAKGFEHVHNLPGSWQAWRNAKYPVEK